MNASGSAIVATDRPAIGIVVPVFRHSGLVAEALASLGTQVGADGSAVAIVNDGCPYRETDLVCLSFAQRAGSPHWHYLKRRNGGLSAARNTGVAFLLARYPSLEAIYLLDADNRLEPHAVARMRRALKDHPAADWFYPNIEMFGLDIVSQYDGAYSRLVHTLANICEAGSLVRRRVFESGLRFDEGMRQGYEDWDFWLGAGEQGFHGRHLPNLGLKYRKRPESMLADSHRDDAEIKSYIRRKRKDTFAIQNLLALEAREAPRYAIVHDDHSVSLSLDPGHPAEVVSFDEFARRIWRWFLRPHSHFAPPFIVSATRSTFDVLTAAGIANWVFWDLEARLRLSSLSAVTLAICPHPGAETLPEERSESARDIAAHVVMISTEFLREIYRDPNGSDWWNSVRTGEMTFAVSGRTLRVEDGRVENLSRHSASARLFQAVNELYHSAFRRAAEAVGPVPYSGVPERHTAYKAVRAAANHGVVFPRRPDGRRHIGIILSFADFGGVEKVAFNTAQVMRAAGFVPHLVLFRVGEIHLPPRLKGVFESILWVTSDNLLRWDGDSFNGTRLSWWSQNGDRTDVVGMLAWFDAVLNCQSADAHGVMGELRRRGVLTLTHQHIVERSKIGRPGGSAAIAKAFEHSYAAILTGSRLLRRWFIANGIPNEKLFNVDNAPSYALPPSLQEEIARERADPHREDGSLRVLFGARFDVQKGIDRVIEIIERTADLPVEWRVVGKAIVDADPLVGRLGQLVPIEPPVYTDDTLTALYRWADVIVLPSRYEGVPLTIIEAMRCGAILIAADAGGVNEVIRSSIDSFIVPQQTCVEDTVTILRRLCSDEGLRRTVSLAAMDAGRSRTWENSLRAVIAFMEARFAASDLASKS